MKRYLEKLDQGTPRSDLSNSSKIFFNRLYNSSKAGIQSFERDFQSMMDAKWTVLQTQLKKVTEERDRLSQADGANQKNNGDLNDKLIMLTTEIQQLSTQKTELTELNIRLTADKMQLVAENNQLAVQKAQLAAEYNQVVARKAQSAAEMSEMETHNEQLTKALARAEIEKKELLDKIDNQKTLMDKEYSSLNYKILEKNIRLNEFQTLNDQLSAKLAAKENEEEIEREKLHESINELFNKKKN